MFSIVSKNQLATHRRVRQSGQVDTVGRLRDATADDAEAILDLVLLSDIAEIGEPNTSINEVRGDLANHGIASAVVEDQAGGLLGYSWIEHHPGHAKTWGDITVKPGTDAWVSSVLLKWLRGKANELGPGLPLHTFAGSTNVMKNRLYVAAGGRVIRHFYRMSVTLGASPPPAPVLRDGVQIRGVSTEADCRTMYEIVDVAFMDHYGHEHEAYESFAQHTYQGASSDLSLWWLATVDGAPAAGLFGSVLPVAGYVDTLGTLRDYRGKGLGRALLLTAFAAFYERGVRKVVLGVDAENPTGALELYESVGMSVDREGVRYELSDSPGA
jgi:mycothiol synthase